MNVFKKALLVSAISLLSVGANAEILSSDWKVLGDSKASIDTVSGIEWLKLSNTKNQSYNDILAQLSSEYLGWRVATQSELTTMLNHTLNFADNTLTGIYTLSASEKSMWFSAFGETDPNLAMGWYQRDSGLLDITGDHGSGSAFYGTGYANANHNNYRSTALTHYGTYLVSDGGITLSSINDPSINANNPNAPEITSVPLPASLGLLALSILGFSARRKPK